MVVPKVSPSALRPNRTIFTVSLPTRVGRLKPRQTNLRSRNLQTRSPGERPQILARGAPGFSGRLFQTSPACFVNIEYRTVSCTDVQGTHVFRGVFRVCSGAPQPRPRRTYGERTSLSRAQTLQSAHGTHAARIPPQPRRMPHAPAQKIVPLLHAEHRPGLILIIQSLRTQRVEHCVRRRQQLERT